MLSTSKAVPKEFQMSFELVSALTDILSEYLRKGIVRHVTLVRGNSYQMYFGTQT